MHPAWLEKTPEPWKTILNDFLDHEPMFNNWVIKGKIDDSFPAGYVPRGLYLVGKVPSESIFLDIAFFGLQDSSENEVEMALFLNDIRTSISSLPIPQDAQKMWQQKGCHYFFNALCSQLGIDPRIGQCVAGIARYQHIESKQETVVLYAYPCLKPEYAAFTIKMALRERISKHFLYPK